MLLFLQPIIAGTIGAQSFDHIRSADWYWDGINITDYNLDGLKIQIGFVFQNTVLFYGTIRFADKIVVIKDGNVSEEGSYEGLIARKEIYAELYQIQYMPPTTFY